MSYMKNNFWKARM